MVIGEAIKLPVRVGVGAARLCLRAAAGVLSIAAGAAETVVDGVVSRKSVMGPDPSELAKPPEIDPEPAEPRHRVARPTPPPPLRPPRPPAPAEPGHVSKEPWRGYDEMNAREVIGGLAAASSAEVAAVQLYESGHRRRQTILNAVERELQSANGGTRRQERGTD